MSDALVVVLEDLRGRAEFKRTYSVISNYIESIDAQVRKLQDEVAGLRAMGKKVPESVGEMKFAHQETHLCYRCAHQDVCKVPAALGDNEILVTIVSCAALIDTDELQEAIDGGTEAEVETET